VVLRGPHAVSGCMLPFFAGALCVAAKTKNELSQPECSFVATTPEPSWVLRSLPPEFRLVQCPLGREAEGGRGRTRRQTTPRRSVAGPTAAREKTKMRAKTKMSCSRPRRLRANGRQATAVLASRPRLRTRCCSRADSGRARLRASRLRTTSTGQYY
jgi:hypothetical protein